MRLLRSLLYMPSSNLKTLNKSVTLTSCDGFIFDLEDAVPEDAKDVARIQACKVWSENRDKFAGRSVAIRINGVDSAHFQRDLDEIRKSTVKPQALVLPKAESVRDVLELKKMFGSGETEIWCMIETPRGVLESRELAKESPVLIMGLEDLSKELKCSKGDNRAALTFSMQSTLVSARASNALVVDGVFTDLKDDAGFERECQQGRAFGFDGKSLIHPKTVDVANRIFSPSPADVERAKSVVTQYEASRGGAIKGTDGVLIENLHYQRALEILKVAERAQRSSSS